MGSLDTKKVSSLSTLKILVLRIAIAVFNRQFADSFSPTSSVARKMLRISQGAGMSLRFSNCKSDEGAINPRGQ